MTIREASRQQFSDGSSIDGNRLDRAIDDLWSAFMAIEPRWQEYLWVKQTFDQGFIPIEPDLADPVNVSRAPFLPINNDLWTVGPPTGAPYNPWRYKGTFVDGIDPKTLGGPGSDENQYAWETAHWFQLPVILQSLSWVLHTDGDDYPNTFLYGTPPPPGKTNGQPVEDIIVELDVDNPFSPETRSQTAVEVHKLRFRATAQFFVPVGNAAYSTDSQPAAPSGQNPRGVTIDLSDLNIPIPRRSRVRSTIVLPQYDTGTYTTGWGADSTRRQWYSNTMTVLESVQ
jgi:hypothetical protein